MMIFVIVFLDTFGQDYKWISAVMMGVLGVGFVVTRILAFRKKKS
jgi:formate-dependent nitrite reductase membrane component NrfD